MKSLETHRVDGPRRLSFRHGMDAFDSHHTGSAATFQAHELCAGKFYIVSDEIIQSGLNRDGGRRNCWSKLMMNNVQNKN
jgi:hypothetical protein